MSYPVKNGQASVVLRLKLLDSSSTVGAGLTGLTSASAGLIISTIADNEATATTYTQAGSTIESITTLGTFAAPTATKVRFKEVDATNHKGVYEFQIADARFAVSSAKSLLISILGATNLAQADYVLGLVSDDPYVAKPTNSSLLSIDGSGRVDVIKIAGTTQSARDIGASVLLAAGQKVDVDTIKTQAVTCAAGVTVLASVGTAATSTAQTGDNFARLGAPAGASVSADIVAVTAKTALIPGTQDGKTFAQTMLLMASALLGKASGMATTTAVFRAVDDSKDRITATVDANGNRSAVTLDAT